MIGGVLRQSPIAARAVLGRRQARMAAGTTAAEAVTAAPACPTCGKVMFRRIAKRGSQAGLAFWKDALKSGGICLDRPLDSERLGAGIDPQRAFVGMAGNVSNVLIGNLRTFIAPITYAVPIQRLLEHLGLPARPPPRSPVHAPMPQAA